MFLLTQKERGFITCTRSGFLSVPHEEAVFSGATTGHRHVCGVWHADTWPVACVQYYTLYIQKDLILEAQDETTCVACWHLACCGRCSLLPPQLTYGGWFCIVQKAMNSLRTVTYCIARWNARAEEWRPRKIVWRTQDETGIKERRVWPLDTWPIPGEILLLHMFRLDSGEGYIWLLWRGHSSRYLLWKVHVPQNQHSTIRTSLLKSVIRGRPGHWQDRNEKIKAHFTDKSKIRERWQVCRCEGYKRVLVYQ